MAFSDRQILDALSRTPFTDSAELAGILGEPHATVHRTLTDLLCEGVVGRISHDTVHLPSSRRHHLTTDVPAKLTRNRVWCPSQCQWD